MEADRRIDRYLEAAIELGLYSSPGRLRFHMEQLFDGVELEGARVLDVGGGVGLYSFYAALRGASEVVCLEPESEGSSEGMTRTFDVLRERLDLPQVQLERVTLQEFEPRGRTFDVILLYNSVNHLDEAACMRLPRDAGARATYRDVFGRLFELAAPGAVLIVCDCARRNAFGSLGLRNPFVPTIEWNKHQQPGVWARLLEEAGFRDPRVRWSSFNRLGRCGARITGNPLAAFFLSSHFCLRMRKPRPGDAA